MAPSARARNPENGHGDDGSREDNGTEDNGTMSGTRDDDKSQRLRAALRDNLKRRKAQARGRAATGAEDDAPATPPEDATDPGRRDVR
ncbi:MAG: hypothetical protein PGN34_05065 [Methylobacterium frigidaeris]